MTDYTKLFEAISPFYKICSECGSLELINSKYCWECHSQSFNDNQPSITAKVKEHRVLREWIDSLSYQSK